MRLEKGTENKRHVIVASVLLGVIALLVVWEAHGALGGTNIHASSRPGVAPSLLRASRQSKGANVGTNQFQLRMDELSRTEQMEYEADGRNIFAQWSPPAIETPIAPARPVPVTPAPVEAQPTVPTLDLKYLGFAEAGSEKKSALFVHGGDIVLATTGDIMFHRFRVGAIQASAVQVTDLASNSTRSIQASN